MICTYCRDVSLSLFFLMMMWCSENRAVLHLPVFTIGTDAVMKMSLAQMHAPSFEAVNQITTLNQAARSVLLLLLLFFWMYPLAESFFSWEPYGEIPRPSEAGWSRCGPQWGAWTHLHTKRLESTQRKWCIIWYLIVMSFVNCVVICSLSSTFCHLLQHWRRSDLRLWSVH